MQYMLKSIAAELTRSVSTALILWGGSPRCPDLVCAEVPRCGDCICQEGKRQAPLDSRCAGFSFSQLLLGIFFGFIAGLLLQQWLTARSTVVGTKPAIVGSVVETAKAIRPAVESSECGRAVSPDFRAEARAQAISIRRYGGAR